MRGRWKGGVETTLSSEGAADAEARAAEPRVSLLRLAPFGKPNPRSSPVRMRVEGSY